MNIKQLPFILKFLHLLSSNLASRYMSKLFNRCGVTVGSGIASYDHVQL